MGETAVRFLMENVSRLLEDHPDVISGAENELCELMMDLDLLTAYCRDAARKEGPLGEREIKKAVYELEDAIDACLTKNRKMSLQCFGQGNKMAEKVKDLRLRCVKEPIDAYFYTSLISDSPATDQRRKAIDLHTRPAIADFSRHEANFQASKSDAVIVGFEDEEETIIGYLTKPKEELDVIYITGVRGLGKTTLSWKIYENERIAHEFPIRMWTDVSRNSKYRDVAVNILKMFTSEDSSSLSDQLLIETVGACLKKKKFLFVLDGVSSDDDWKIVRDIMPHSNGSRGKVLITSWDNYVGKSGYTHKLRFLTRDESWKLLQLEAFGNLRDCPPELEEVGQGIAGKCGGLPLQIVLVGGTLAGLGPIKLEWQKVFENENLFLHNESISNVVQLTYSELPDDLRECFLYLAVFPKGYEIPVWSLTRLWIAEGFVRSDVGGQSLEETATQNLYHLITRNLVVVDKTNPMGEVKTCRVHDMVHAFCIHKAREQSLFQEINRSQKRVCKLQKCRRLCVHDSEHLGTLLSQVPKGLRSFLCFYKELVCLHPKYISSISDLLRVLDSKMIKFDTFPTRITGLIHLRYITMYVDELHILPHSLSKLWNLQTLVVDTASRSVTMEANIWRMRHVKTNAAIVLSSSSRGEAAGENLQTLNTLSPESCTEDVSRRARNLKTLRIRGELQTLFGKSFLDKLVRLEELKLVNDHFLPEERNPVPGLPQPNCFPPNLRRLTLSKTFLQWSHLSTLAKINTLEVLKLKDNAFTGYYWDLEGGCFPSLRFLLIANSDLFIWVASADSLPSLRCLVFNKCRNLDQFPVPLKSLEKLEIHHVGKSAVVFAKRMAQQRAKSGFPFNLSITPPR